jgi:hypothetical protein
MPRCPITSGQSSVDRETEVGTICEAYKAFAHGLSREDRITESPIGSGTAMLQQEGPFFISFSWPFKNQSWGWCSPSGQRPPSLPVESPRQRGMCRFPLRWGTLSYSADSKPRCAGPLRILPNESNRDPWQGQSQLCSTLFQLTRQPR